MEEIKTKPSLISLSDLFYQAIEVYRGKFWRLMGMIVIPCLISVIPIIFILSLYAIFRLLPLGSSAMITISIILGLLGILATLFMAVVIFISRVALMVMIKENNNQLGLKEYWRKGQKVAWQFFTTSLLSGILLILLFCLLIVPGIIFLVFWLFVSWIVINEGLVNRVALRRSKQLVSGYWWPIFGRLLLLFLFLILFTKAPFSAFISWLLLPFCLAYIYEIYKSLVEIKGRGEVK